MMPSSGDTMDRRSSNASDSSLEDGAARKLSLHDGTEFIPTRSSKVAAPKPAANPLQFIKVGPCDLYKSAQEQIKRVEEVKRIKETVKEEAEDWQSNLDNWKCSRRKRQEHIIERVVEVKKLEMEEHDRNRRRSKTFNEMMEQRNSRGRKTSLMVYKDDEANDLSDLGIGTSSGDDNHSLSDRDERTRNGVHDNDDSRDERPTNGTHDHNNSLSDREERRRNGISDDNHSLSDQEEKQSCSNGNGTHTDTLLESSQESTEEYTYDRAIQTYVNFTETRVKGRNNNNEDGKSTENLTNGYKNSIKKTPPQVAAKPKRETGSKVEEKLSLLEERRRSSTDLSNVDKVKLPKVDVLKRREQFEKADPEMKSSNKITVNNSQSIKERLSNLEKQGEANGVKNANRLSGEITGSIKDRLSSLEQQKSTEKLNGKDELVKKRLSNGDLPTAQSVKERLSNLQKQGSTDTCKDTSAANSKVVSDVTLKDRLSNLDSAINKDIKKVTPDRDPTFSSKLANFQSEENGFDAPLVMDKPERSSSPDEDEIYATKRQQFHRSLDSLDVEGDLTNETFERVQSLEDLDCLGRRNYPPSASSIEMLVFSSQSGDTDREDSGIHTADVSSSVSQADEPVEDGDIMSAISNIHLETNSDNFLDIEITSHRRQTSELSEQLSPLPPIQEVETFETTTVFLHVEESPERTQSDDEPLEAVITSHQPVVDVMMPGKGEFPLEKMEEPNEIQTFEIRTESLSSPRVEENMIETEIDNGKYEEKIENSSLPMSAYNGLFSAKSGEEIFLPVSTTEILPLSLNVSSMKLLDGGLAFPLAPPSSVEPPREKPPPPPTESDDEAPKPKSSLRRVDSTKRIKKEIRQKRSDFLGIEGVIDDDSYLEPVLSMAPPDMTAFLIEEQRQEKQLYRQSICSESDSNPGESRDSGVELDRPQVLTPDQSAQHSRQESELYGITSEEDEISKKEREIIEILEKEEQWRYANNPSEEDLGEKLAEKLRQLEQEKLRLEWERAEEENRRMTEENLRREEKMRLRAKEQELRQQENPENVSTCNENSGEGSNLVEGIRAERERLQREQEELVNQRENLLLRESQQAHRSAQQWDVPPSSAVSLQDISGLPPAVPPAPLNYRLSLPDLQEQAVCEQQLPRKSHRPPPPIPPSKPLRSIGQEQQERENSIRNSRTPSAETSYPMEGSQPRHNSVSSSNPQQMTRQTLQALSAAPRSRIVSTDTWIQAKKKPESQRNSYNYQHWLIQEAEHRRITEQQQRNAAPTSPRKSVPTPQWNQPQQQREKPLPDSIIQTLTQRVQNRVGFNDKTSPPRREQHHIPQKSMPILPSNTVPNTNMNKIVPPMTSGPNMHTSHSPVGGGDSQEKMLSVSGKKKCSHCGDELGRGAAMIIESLRLFYHIDCFKCCVCHVQLGDGLMGTDVRVRNNKLHCHNCYSSDDGVKFSCV